MSEPYAQNKPRVGQPITYRGEHVGTVQRVEGNLCWVDYPTGTDPFIWRFKDGLNTLHDWPTKTAVSPATVDISTIYEYGLTQKLSNSIRCF